MENLRNLLESSETHDILFFTLGETYEQLILKNVPVPEDIQVKVEKKLLGHQFITEKAKLTTDQFKSFESIKEHVDFTCSIIDQFLSKYFEKEFEVDLEFTFCAKYIAQNMSVLKRRIDYTYGILPWEEMQFCLAIYVYSLTKRTHTDIVYKLVLDKNRILQHLFYFYKILKAVKKNLKEENLLLKKPINRNINKNKILKESPYLKNLYEDFSILRDVFSLIRIKSNLEQTLSVDLSENTVIGQLVIERTLQVLGECLKNTVDSPNISDDLYKFLIRIAPRNLRSILANVRNMLSHAFSLNRKLELESSKDVNFFKSVQLDLNRVHVEIVYMLYLQKINAIKMFLTKILNQDNLLHIECIFKEINIKKNEINDEYHIEFGDFLKVNELVDLFCQQVLEESNEDYTLIEEVKKVMELYKTKVNVVSSMFMEGIHKIIMLEQNKRVLNTIHSLSRTYLVTLTSSEPQSLFKKVFKKLHTINENFKRRRKYDANNFLEPDEKSIELGKIITKIYNHIKCGMQRIKWIEEIENTLTIKVDVHQEQTKKINNIFEAIESKLDKDEDKIILHDVVVQKIQIHLGKAEIINNFDKGPETFERIVKSLRLSTKREKEILHNFETTKYERLQLQLKEINDDYGTLIKQLGDIFPLNKYTNSLKTFYNNLKLKKPLQIKILKAISCAIQEEVIDSYSKRITMLRNIMKNIDFLMIKENRFLRMAIEMLVLDLVEYLQNIKLLGDNKLFIIESLPLLRGKQLRNYLAHGDILTDLLPYNPLIAITFYAEKLADLGEAVLSHNEIRIGCSDSNTNMYDYFQSCVGSITSQELLHDYIKNNDGHKVAEIVNNGAELEGISFKGWSVLDIAIHAGNIELFQFFLKNQQKSNEKIYNWVRTAVISGQFDIMKYMINEFKIDVNYKYNNNLTLFHFALKYGHSHVAKYLAENQVNIYGDQTSNGKIALLFALESRMVDMVTYLLDSYIDLVNAFVTNKFTALHIAAKNNFPEAVEILLQRNGNPFIRGKSGLTAVEIAAQYGHKDVLKTFLIRPSLKFSTELITKVAFLAAENGHLSYTWPLLQKRIKTNSPDGEIFLHQAVFYGHKEDVQMLIKHGADINSTSKKGFKAIHLACQCGHTQVVDLLLVYGADVNAKDNEKLTPLHWATQNNHKNVVKSLLSKNADGKIHDKNGKTALHLAAENGFVDIFHIILKHTGDANIKTENGYTALHLAAENGHCNIANILLNVSHIKVNVTTDNDETSLILAASNGHYNVVEQLLKYGASVNNKSKEEAHTALTRAAVQGFTDIVTILIKNGADIERQEVSTWRALHFAVQNGYTDIFEILIKYGVNINSKLANSGTALLIATRNGHTDIVKRLIKCGADIHAMMLSLLPLRVAAHFGYKDIILMLLKSGAYVNDTGSDGVSPLHSASWNGHIEAVELLLQNGANVNSKTEEQWTALHFAAKFGYYDIVQLLIETGADISSKNNFGATVFHTACEMGYSNITTMLLERYNVNVDTENTDGWTGLHWACANGHVKVVKALIKHRARINVKAKDASTPLHWAIQYTGSADIVNILLQNNAEVNLKDDKGSTPLHLASLKGYKNITEMLLQANADVNAENNDVTALHLVATFGHYDILHMLLDKGAQVNSKSLHGKTALHLAAEKGYANIINTLLKNGAEVNERDAFGMTPLHLAAEKGHGDIVKALIKSYSEVNTRSNNGYSPLDSAIANYHENVAVLLIVNNASISTKIYEKCTITHVAIRKGMTNVIATLIHRNLDLDIVSNPVTYLMESFNTGHEDIAALLLQNNANFNIINSAEWTPLHVAAGKGYKKVFNILVKGKVNINAKTCNWETPLYFASLQGHYDFVMELLENDADVNVQSKSNGWTALSVAAQEGHSQIIELLIKYKADINVKGDRHLTPLHLSVLYGHEKSVQILLKHNADTKAKTDNHWTALHLAASEGFATIVKLLLRHNAHILDDQTDEEATALYLAVEQGHKNVVEELIKYKANIEITGNMGTTPTELATRKGFADIAAVLFQRTTCN